MSNNKDSLLEQAEKNGFSLKNGFKQIGFVIDDLAASQVAYLCIQSSNQWLHDNIGVDISIFYNNNSVPCVAPHFARYHVRDCIGFSGDLIATSTQSINFIKKATRARRYYYINNWMDVLHDETMRDSSITKIFRCNDYLEEFKKRYNYLENPNISVEIVKDFDINTILEIVNGSHN